MRCAAWQRYRRRGRPGAEGSAEGQHQCADTEPCECVLVVFVVFVLRVFCCCEESRAADVCGAAGQQNRRRGRQGAGGSAEGQYQCAETVSCKCILVGFVVFLFCACFVVARSLGRLTCAVQYNNGIGAEGGKALGEALKVNTSVQILDLVSVFLLFL